MEPLDPDHVEWSRKLFAMLAEGGSWGVPRSGLFFRKRGNTLELAERMPHDPAMPLSAAELAEQQDRDFEGVKRHFEAAGASAVIDKTKP